jgi:hypothetical protein
MHAADEIASQGRARRLCRSCYPTRR